MIKVQSRAEATLALKNSKAIKFLIKNNWVAIYPANFKIFPSRLAAEGLAK